MSRNRLTETAALAGLLATGERISQQPDQTRSLNVRSLKPEVRSLEPGADERLGGVRCQRLSNDQPVAGPVNRGRA
jgi:hypothetical protein